jgi:hypothetical protein
MRADQFRSLAAADKQRSPSVKTTMTHDIAVILSRLEQVYQGTGFSAEFDPDQRIATNKWVEFSCDHDAGQFVSAIEYHFGVALGADEIQRAFDSWDKSDDGDVVTWRWLAGQICAALPAVSFEPLDICGTRCQTAGLFRGLEQLATHPDAIGVAPSTRILDHLQGAQLHRFWSQTKYLLNVDLPPLVSWTETVATWGAWGMLICAAGLFVSMIVTVVCVLLGIEGSETVLRASFTGWLLSVPFALACQIPPAVWGPRVRTLPDGLKTFGDLARRLNAIIGGRSAEA